MELEQYAYYSDPELKDNCYFSFSYWRKHYQLNEWMQSLYEQKGGNGEFNGDFVELTKDDLLALDKATDDDHFYNQFEDPYWKEWTKKCDKQFIKKALELINKKFAISYCVNW